MKHHLVPLAAAATMLATPIHAGPLLHWSDAEHVARGATVYAEHCAACHGADLEGAENWRSRDAEGLLPAPPHDASGHSWHHPDALLFQITKYGVGGAIGDPSYRSNMPAFDGVLSDEEIIAALSFIKSTWPPEIIAHHDMLNARSAQ